MKVPKAIQDAIRKNAKANATANKTDAIIREWMIKNNIHNDSVIDQLIDSCSQICDPEAFIEFLKSGKYFEGNDGV